MNRKKWTAAEDRLLAKLYPDTATAKLSTTFGVSISKLYSRAKYLGIAKSEAFLKSQESGRLSKLNIKGEAYRFKKGMCPHNAGKRGLQPFHGPGLFKKGNKPQNTKQDGDITLRSYGTKKQYYFIRLSENKWELLHKELWRQHHGEIPKGQLVCFKDGNPLNCVIGNLELISRKENLRRNRVGWKIAYAMREKAELGWDAFGAKQLTDNYVAAILSGGDRSLMAEIMDKHQELIKVKRTQLQLNRLLKNENRRTKKQA